MMLTQYIKANKNTVFDHNSKNKLDRAQIYEVIVIGIDYMIEEVIVNLLDLIEAFL